MTDKSTSSKTKKAKPLLAFMCMSCNDPETSEIVFAKSNVEARRIHTNSQGSDFADANITRKKEFDQYAPGPVPPKALLYDGWWFDCTGCGRTLNLSDDDMWVDGDDVDELKEMADHNARIDRELAAFDRQQALDEAAAKAAAEKDPAAAEAARIASNRQSYYDTPQHRRAMIAEQSYPQLLDPKALRFIGEQTFCHVACQQDHYANIAKINVQHEEAEEAAAALFPEGSDFTCRRYPYLESLVEFKVEGLQYSVAWDPKEPSTVRVSNADKSAWAELMARRTLQTA
jgi:hypothetical protein